MSSSKFRYFSFRIPISSYFFHLKNLNQIVARQGIRIKDESVTTETYLAYVQSHTVCKTKKAELNPHIRNGNSE